MDPESTDELYMHYVRSGDVGALAEVFDRLAPDLASLARRLVRGREEAEDLVQETFLVAIERPEGFDESRALEPWLVGIMVNRARAARRVAARIVDAERLVEREVKRPDEEASLAEDREALASAVAELPESLRLVVQAKLDGTGAIASSGELGVSDGALRVRLHRALQRLRVSLPAGLAALLAAVFLGSRGLARIRARVLERGESHPLANRSAASSKLGLFSPQLVIAAVAGIAILVIATSHFWRPTVPERSASPGSAVANSEVRGSTAGEASDTAMRSPSTRTTARVVAETSGEPELEAPELEPSSLAGRVVDQDGVVVPNAEVLAWNSPRNNGEPDLGVVTNDRGEFMLEGLGPEFVITAKTKTLVCSLGLRGKRPAGSFAEGLELKLAPAGVMRGVIKSPEGVPIANAEVWLTNGLYSRSQSDLTAVDGVTTFSAGQGATTSSPNGEFEIAGIPPKQLYLQAKSKPYLVHREYHNRTEGPVVVVLDPGLTIRGNVRASSGEPAVGARLRMWPFFGNLHTVDREVVTDSNGAFVLSSVLRREAGEDVENHAIGILFDDHAVEVIQPVVPSELGGRDLSIELVPERRIAGRVVDLQGAPVSGLKVWIEGDRELDTGAIFDRRGTWEYHCGLGDAETDADGRFSFDQLYEGEFVVHVLLSETGDLSIERKVESGEEGLEFVFDPVAARKVVIAGRVKDAMTGEAIRSYRATSWSASDVTEWGARGKNARLDEASGRYELAGLDEDEIAVSFKADGYNDLRIEEKFYALGEHSLDVALIPSRTLVVSVVDSLGPVTEPGYVRALRADGKAVQVESDTSLEVREIRLLGGKAFLHGLPAEALTLEVEVAPFRVVQLPVDLTTPFEGELEVFIDRVPPVALILLVLVGGTDVDPTEIAEQWSARKYDDDGWNRAFSTLYFTRGVLPGVVVEMGVLDSRGRGVAVATLTPSETNSPVEFPRQDGEVGMMYSIESTTEQRGPVGYSSSGPSILPELRFELPRERVRLVIKAEGFRLVDKALDLSQLAGDELVEVVVLEPLDR